MRRQIRTMAELRKLQAMLAKSSPQIAANVATKAAEVLSTLARKSFDAKQSPYGVPFGTGEDGHQLDLNESGAIRDKAIRYTAQGRKITASINAVRHAKYHANKGILPRSGELPSDWQEAVEDVAQAEIERAVQL